MGFTSHLKKDPELPGISLSLRVHRPWVQLLVSGRFVACDVPTPSCRLPLSSKCTPVPPGPPINIEYTHAFTHCIYDNVVQTQARWHCSPSDSGIIITIQKVKHSASTLFSVIYAFVLLLLFALISICKSNHAASPSQLLALSGQKLQPTGNGLCKYSTVDTRRASLRASLPWWDDQGTDTTAIT